MITYLKYVKTVDRFLTNSLGNIQSLKLFIQVTNENNEKFSFYAMLNAGV